MADFKIRVVENIGKESKEVFGEKGTEHIVANGNLVDLEGFSWKKYGFALGNIKSINWLFGREDSVQTVFELVVES